MTSNNPSQLRAYAASHHADHLSQQKSFDPWMLWVTVRRCWPWAVPIGTLLACVATIVIMETFVPRYRAEHWLEAKEDYLVFKGVMPTIRDLSATEKPLFFNSIVLDPVLADPSLRKAPSLSNPENAEANLKKNLSVASGGTRSRLVVSYVDTDRVAAAMVCNAVVDSYLRIRDQFDSRQVQNLERWLTPEIARWESAVEERQKAVEELSKSTLGFAPGQRVAVMEDASNLALVTELRSQITDLKVQLAVMDAQQQMEQADVVATVPVEDIVLPKVDVQRRKPTESEIVGSIENDAVVMEAREEVQYFKSLLLELEVKDLVRFDRARHQELQDKRDQAIAKLEEARTEARGRAEELLNQLADEDFERRKREAEFQNAAGIEAARSELVLQRAEHLRSREAERNELAAQLEVLQKSYDEERLRLEQFGGESAKLQFAREELAVAADVLRKLRDRVAMIRTERQYDGSVRTLAVAQTPRTPVETIPFKKIVGVAGAVFLIPFAFGFLWEYRVQRVTDSGAIENANLAPIMGEVARLPSGNKSHKNRRQFEESIDTLRANLFLSLETKDTRSIAVVSSMSGEGKSSVASQLALSIAKASGQTVLLVDTDLRCPDQHEIFGLEAGPGLSAVLAGKASLEDSINRSLGDLIHVLPAGRLDRSPHRLMNPDSITSFVNQALETYSYVIFDTAPVLSAGETLAVASAVDATLLCVMRDVSRMDNLTRTMRRLEASANIAGTVFSGITASQYSYRYGDYHYAVAAGDYPS